MATPANRLPDNASGDFYVDSTCIDCDTCRRVAPAVFAEGEGHSFVHAQPRTEPERRRALMALVACPTASIGTATKTDATPGVRAYPETIEENVSFCGFTAESSFGAWSYLIERRAGGSGDHKVPRLSEGSGGRKAPGSFANVLVDSPRAAGPLLKALEERGGVATLFLTHRDDVADHAALSRRFGCERILHEDDVTRGTQEIERPLSGSAPIRLADDLLVIPTPGHTRGHAVLLYRDKYLFTGDHLAWSLRRGQLVAFRDANWYSWPATIRSMERLLDFRFEWVLPGHGSWHHAESPAAMRREVEKCVAWMKER
jgi:glyoxylase-like metal-dependent hydrolase (beta-lactamase superfamily II)/ferredoxin